MAVGFFSLLEPVPEGFTGGRPSPGDLSRRAVILLAPSKQAALRLIAPVRSSMRGLVITPGKLRPWQRIGPSVWHLTLDRHMLGLGRTLADGLVPFLLHAYKTDDQRLHLRREKQHLQDLLEQTRQDYNDVTRRLFRRMAQVQRLNQSLQENVRRLQGARQDLMRQTQRFRDMVEGSSDFLWEVDAASRFSYASPGAKSLLGYRPAELLGKAGLDLIVPADRARIREIVKKMFTGFPRREVAEYRVLHKHGKNVILESSVVGIRDAHGRITGLRGVGRDITARRQGEAALRDSEKLFRDVFDQARDMMSIYEPATGRLVAFNPSLTRVLGFEPEGLRRMTAAQVDRIFGWALLRPRLEDILARPRPVMVDYLNRRRQTVKCTLVLSAIHFQGRSAILCVARDVSWEWNRAQLEQEVQQREQRRIGAKLHDEIGQDLAMATYRLRTAQRRLPAASAEVSGLIDATVELIGGVTTSVRDLSHDLVPPEIPGQGLWPALEQLARLSSDIWGIDCALTGRAQAGTEDEVLVRQLYLVTQESIRNAVHHARARRIRLMLASTPREIRLQIVNDGQPYKASRRRPGGRGLAIMRNRLDMLGGTFEIRCGPAGGAVVSCVVPVPLHRPDLEFLTRMRNTRKGP